MADVVLWGTGGPGPAAWTAQAADDSRATAVPDGAALRLDVVLGGPTSWAIARCARGVVLPAHWVVVLRVRGTAPPNVLQVKLVDDTGANVWWWRRPDFVPSPDGATLTLRRAALAFAWGPRSGGEPDRVGAVEVAVASGTGGAGTYWIEALRVEERDPPPATLAPVAVVASSGAASAEAWQPAPDDPAPWLQLDLGRRAEWGGLVVDVRGADGGAPATTLLASDDGATWTPVAAAPAGAGGRRWLRTDDGEGRVLRLVLGAPATVAAAEVVPLELAVAPSRWAAAAARDAPRGRFPRHVLDEQGYWAAVGADGDDRTALLGEDGAVEIGLECPSIEPFLWSDGRLVGWADATITPSLADGALPLPSVTWAAEDLRLAVTPFADGDAGTSTLVVRYVVANAGAQARAGRLLLAVRPFQVTPAWQSLNLTGGIARIGRVVATRAALRVNDAHAVCAVTPPHAVRAAATGALLPTLAAGRLPDATDLDDPLGFAEGVLAFDWALAPGAQATVAVAVPREGGATPPSGLDRAAAAAWVDARHAAAVTWWRARLAAIPIALPPAAGALGDAFRASVGWILVNREGPRIQPGPRTYRRSWIRDGALTGTALAEVGFGDVLSAFLDWYAPWQLPDGRVPCAVDHRGVDPVPEHDSHGELAWGVVEAFRLDGDAAALSRRWPHVRAAADAIAALRATRMTPAEQGTARWGLVPESISHEGYSSRPVHAFWDDAFAVLGLTAAADAARTLGHAGDAARFAALAAAMRTDVHASIARTMADHGLDVLPGSVELGDFDPTSSAIFVDPCDDDAHLPPGALQRTFARWWDEIEARRAGRHPNDAYTPYEVRNAVALLALGWAPRAVDLLETLCADQRPPAWRQWPEIAWRDARAPRFLGDLPHGWVASSFVRAVRRLVAWERGDALVLAAGVPAAWVTTAPGVVVRGLPTHHGRLDLTLGPDGGGVRARLGGALRWPSGGVVLHAPGGAPLRAAVVDGTARAPDGAARVVLHRPARDVLLVPA